MIRFFRHMLLTGALFCWSCSDNTEPASVITPATGATVEDLAGEWQLTAWSGDQQRPGDIYLRLNADGTFTLYQDINAHGFRQYDGTFAFDPANAVIRGTYADNTPWGGVYVVGALTAESMQWQKIGSNDISTYTRTEIPELTIDPAALTKAAPAAQPFL
ncbi:MAG: lipocalin family protein [Alistipes sp.]|nr:lipocalin family protein [Alistipes sp.]